MPGCVILDLTRNPSLFSGYFCSCTVTCRQFLRLDIRSTENLPSLPALSFGEFRQQPHASQLSCHSLYRIAHFFLHCKHFFLYFIIFFDFFPSAANPLFSWHISLFLLSFFLLIITVKNRCIPPVHASVRETQPAAVPNRRRADKPDQPDKKQDQSRLFCSNPAFLSCL